MVPRFISNKKLGTVCNLPEEHPKIKKIYRIILGTAIKEKQHTLFSCILKCNTKEQACQRLLATPTWKRIEKGSRLICDSVRSSAKSSLCAKYDKLLSATRKNQRTGESNVPEQNRNVSDIAQNECLDCTARVTVIGNTQISDNARKFLSLGPSFSITQNVNESVFRKVITGLYRVRDQLRIRAKNSEKRNSNAQEVRAEHPLPCVPFPSTFYREPQPVPEADVKFRILSSNVLTAYTQPKPCCRTNLTYSEMLGYKEVRDLIRSEKVRISVSDKGGEFVIMPQELDREITELHLNDKSVYKRVSEKEYHSQYKRLNHVWMSIGKSAGLSESFLARLKK
ncbi:unnamed protein product [Cylicocyclus nassatus]|uniref:Uncharacterized protein n=1 Tax=Cylicocyclus nassatus TaxID=53992 RepID=A0AA36GQF8_CYLNA|nr:unnamed protein product [Cylicocyclus nassatus]